MYLIMSRILCLISCILVVPLRVEDESVGCVEEAHAELDTLAGHDARVAEPDAYAQDEDAEDVVDVEVLPPTTCLLRVEAARVRHEHALARELDTKSDRERHHPANDEDAADDDESLAQQPKHDGVGSARRPPAAQPDGERLRPTAPVPHGVAAATPADAELARLLPPLSATHHVWHQTPL